ncbi:GNAT family N-acetyltransferase [Polluticaenibacter yanchengensis]|uniref:GNAT family N-acetyltransferase n=1 Tax=Polluticaenibacter yanchengensis TaxID=3014562 RepID=A0ABT4UHN7_9BACT|nr:GNAT family N-acetyltransferase [Chitinophagaceae bacterium LY-5]
MSGNVTIRWAEERDCERMLELVKELAVYEKEPQAVTVTLDHFRQSGFGPAPVWKAFVAEKLIDNKMIVIGFALFYIRYSTWKGQMVYLEDFYVMEEHRGQKTGKELFETVVNYAKENGYYGMIWQVLDWNEPAINFYKKYHSHFDAGWINTSIRF